MVGINKIPSFFFKKKKVDKTLNEKLDRKTSLVG